MKEIEADIRPEDFKEGSVWRALIKECGAKAALILAQFHGGNKLHILTEDKLAEPARKRFYKKRKADI